MASQTKSSLDKRVVAGSRSAFHQFYRLTKPKLEAYLNSRVGDARDVEELAQDTYLSFLDSLPLYRGQASLWTFLMSIARHEVADYYRKKYAKRVLELVPFVDKGYTPDLYTARETRDKFVAALNDLLPEQRQLIVWKYELNWSVEQIASKLKITTKAAESRLFRARKAFQGVYGYK